MNKYAQISKRIGWEGFCAIPSVEAAREINAEVVNNHCESAFTLAFKVHRFSPTPETDEEREVMCLIDEAYIAGRNHFRNIEAA